MESNFDSMFHGSISKNSNRITFRVDRWTRSQTNFEYLQTSPLLISQECHRGLSTNQCGEIPRKFTTNRFWKMLTIVHSVNFRKYQQTFATNRVPEVARVSAERLNDFCIATVVVTSSACFISTATISCFSDEFQRDQFPRDEVKGERKTRRNDKRRIGLLQSSSRRRHYVNS